MAPFGYAANKSCSKPSEIEYCEVQRFAEPDDAQPKGSHTLSRQAPADRPGELMHESPSLESTSRSLMLGEQELEMLD